MASKSMASPALLCLAMALVLATSVKAQAPAPTPAPTPVPTPAPTPAPTTVPTPALLLHRRPFSNKRAFKQAFPEFYNRRILLVLYLVKLSASSPITTFPKPNLLGFTKCNCYFDNPFNISTSSITCMPASFLTA
uniref:FAS1 domain-containing protein n=1 Tax=Setaria viridis TaxID=4556 RepID=A0A4U6V158_SETVI|nr:hypothetical protein SEVIR_4G202800v2 [Setaria viridis]